LRVGVDVSLVEARELHGAGHTWRPVAFADSLSALPT
jgi:hypothetical protein